MFSLLLLNYSQSLNTFEIVVWKIFTFIDPQFMDLAAKPNPIGGNYKWESHQADLLQI